MRLSPVEYLECMRSLAQDIERVKRERRSARITIDIPERPARPIVITHSSR